jgi:hypothetical protein
MWFMILTAFAADGEALKQAAELPVLAHDLRGSGLDTNEVDKAVAIAKDKGLKTEEATEVLRETKKDVDEHGPVDNFGAFVQSKLDEGLRGTDLAAAIKAEHQANGKGKGFGKGKAGEHGKAGEKHGKKGEHGEAGEEHGKKGEHGEAGEEHGKKGVHGKADEDHGKKGTQGAGGQKGVQGGGKKGAEGKGAKGKGGH